MRTVFTTEEAASLDEVRRAADTGAAVHVVAPRILASLSDAATPQGVVAVAVWAAPLEEHLASGDLVAVLADVRDPGNAGTIVRSAVAAGASAVVFTVGAVDPFNPKTLRASAGTIFHVPLFRDVPLERAASTLKRDGFELVGADARAGRPVYEVDLSGRIAFVLGNEAWGIPASARNLLDEIVTIPMRGPAESLNVAVAASVLLFEAVRQRGIPRVGGATSPGTA